MTTFGNLFDLAWVLICAALVFLMQAGYCCLESGSVRAKSSINVAAKSLVNLCLAGFLFWILGFGLMFGASWQGVFGRNGFILGTEFNPTPTVLTFFLFQMLFCATAAAIVSGAVAERLKFSANLCLTGVLVCVIYPIFGHWVWGGVLTDRPGWLHQMGFVDFAGGTVVHSVGAWMALACCLLVGPRLERFEERGITGHNLPLATLGVMLVWFGWFGFTGGSTLGLSDALPRILVNTMLAGVCGGLFALAASCYFEGRPDVVSTLVGVIAGLVSITAGCHAVAMPAAAFIGGAGAVMALGAMRLLERLRIDDAIHAIPMHGIAGAWGTLAVALFGEPHLLGTGLGRWSQVSVQLLGIAVCFVSVFCSALGLVWIARRLGPFRVTPDEERAGLNLVEHGTGTELNNLLQEMEHQRRTSDFTQPVSVESHTEVGQVAAQYNRVLEVVNTSRRQLESANSEANHANRSLAAARDELAQKLIELEEFNRSAVGRELRMVELKEEINRLSERLGESPPHPVDRDQVKDTVT